MKIKRIAAALCSAAIMVTMSGCAENLGKFDASSAVTIYLVDCDTKETITLKNGEGEDDFDKLTDIFSTTVKRDDKDKISASFGSCLVTFESESGKTNFYPSSDSNFLARESYDGEKLDYIKVSDDDMESITSILGTYGVKIK